MQHAKPNSASVGIIYGTAWKKERTSQLVSEALAAGFRGIDTACQPKHYDEAGVGAGIAQWLATGGARAELYVQTKFTSVTGQDPTRIPYDANAPLTDQVAQSFQASLLNLQTTYLDALVLHSPLPTLKQTLVVWNAMEAIVDTGRVIQLGISNCYELSVLEALCRSVRVQPAILQNRFYAESNYDVELRAFCRERGIVYQSFWTLSANPHLLASATITSLSREHGRTPAQILFRYLTQQAVVPLTGTTSANHMRDDLAIVEFELKPEECESITALL